MSCRQYCLSVFIVPPELITNFTLHSCHFWKFAVTGVEGNTELKIWTCETWSCLQTLKYEPIDDMSSSPLKLKVAVDITANYILVSDMQRRVSIECCGMRASFVCYVEKLLLLILCTLKTLRLERSWSLSRCL